MAEAVSLTIPCASWQELPKYWFSSWIFFCRVSIAAMQVSHIDDIATWKA